MKHLPACRSMKRLCHRAIGTINAESQLQRVAGHGPMPVTGLTGVTNRLITSPKDYLKLPPWLVLPDVHHNHHALDGVEADATSFEELYGNHKYQELFDKKVKWFLSSSLILTHMKLDDTSMRELHFQNMSRTGQSPTYVTSLTLMKCLVRGREELWIPIMQSLVADRVMVIYDMEHELTPLRVLFYDLGLMLAPHDGDSDLDTYKIESDASFYKNTVTLPCGKVSDMSTATAASIIWKGGKMIDCQLVSQFPCGDSECAEAIGILIALRRGKSLAMDIQKVDVVTDNLPNYEVLSGMRDIDGCKHPTVMKAILQVSKEYEVCRFRCEERQSLAFVNALSRDAKLHTILSPEGLVDILAMNGSSRLWGMPFIRLKQSETFIRKKLNQVAKPFEPTEFAAKPYYVTVEWENLKYDALYSLMSVLQPKNLIVMVASVERGKEIAAQMRITYSQTTVLTGEEKHGDSKTIDGEALVLTEGSWIPKLSAHKTLLVVFDKPIKPIQYAPGQDTSQVVELHLVLSTERRSLPDSAKEVDPFMYIYFTDKIEKRQTRVNLKTIQEKQEWSAS